MFEKATVSISLTGIIVSSSAPATTDQDKLWIKTSGGNPVRQFIWNGGRWRWPHEIPNGDSRRWLFTGIESAIDTLDGGASGTASPAAGPFWERDTNYNDRIPIGVGASIATVVETNYGDSDSEFEMTEANIPAHTHFIANSDTLNDAATTLTPLIQMAVHNHGSGIGDQDYTLVGTATAATIGLTSSYGGLTAGGVTKINTLNPVRAAFVIQRTARIYYVG
jgi:microcystin-dependent protein